MPLSEQNPREVFRDVVIQREVHASFSLICRAINWSISARWSS
jgi:hypothetical protein